MNKLLRLLTITLSLYIQTPVESFASHAMGAELTYTCLGGNQYQVTFKFYRDCVGIPAPDPAEIDLFSSCYPFQSFFFNSTAGSPQQITQVCPTALTTCDGGAFTGIEEWIYEGIITLPGPCADWRISHSENARNAAITTIAGAGVDPQYVYAIINNTNGICNSSPIFNNRPVPFTCLGQQFCYSNSAYDSEGDSLSYQLITPMVDSVDTVEYLSPYTRSQPMISNPAVTFSSQTGDLCMLPTQPDVTVFAVLVSEYRNGILIGQSERDVQLTIMNCANYLPYLSGFNGSPSTSTTACPNVPLNFFTASRDGDAANTTQITWDNSVPGMSFYAVGGHRDTGFFSWTPTTANVSITPYCFSVYVHDDACPYIGFTIQNFCITVLPSSNAQCQLAAVQSIPKETLLDLFPNPASGKINFKPTHSGKLNVYSNEGKIVFSELLPEATQKSIDVSAWAKGIYEVLLVSPSMRSKARFIIQ
ncbi:MAG TPA: T9SS type A sorting domain-containing protein [Bacteroidia bacterium]|nr:T9SS type A sorting domain-containing protein [Bacteroidia bacterium]